MSSITRFTNEIGNDISYNVTSVLSYNIVSYEITGIMIDLFTSATIYINLITDNGVYLPKRVFLAGDDYFGWGADDNYLLNYIITNIQTIYESLR
jgi:hypothetical protein